jgi:predicted nucleic acid-binding Zn ribbon protein
MPDDPGLREQLATEAFRSAVGPAVAGRCRVIGLRGHSLSLAVSSKRWHGELQRMGPEILDRVNEALPSRARLSAIEFRLQT